ncbi:tRNA 2-thiouridine(34) synthase MnmA [Brachybacterium sp. FME24]|uniref:tRNA 2-thiouridine(34) synthase MnmA n=1 Tax=Brachybacterium sp. FME24 TaxID=2742605 RepID=UPI0018670553|nr:tRNA 2-thiouridine(34) synthase MnmA [Brachybacterium sp. FME24]
MKVLAAMSGGVDSAVAAARAAEDGHEVVGVHMALSKNRDQRRTGSRGCCTVEDASDARRAADRIGIPYYVWDLSDDFHDLVVEDFLSEYAAGRTPNPCVRCNERIKFASLLERATLLGFDAVCTGHYASIRTDGPGGTPSLHRSRNMAKDQSYVLAVMGPDAVARSLFPLGEYETKDEVRAEAHARGLGVSTKPDSYDICFVADGDTRGFLERNLGEAPGEVLDDTGAVIGAHRGTHGFTIGQRKGLGIEHPAADGAPRYVVDIDPTSRQVVVGAAELLSTRELIATDVVLFEPLLVGREVRAQIRAHGDAIPAQVLEVPAAAAPAPGDAASATSTAAHSSTEATATVTTPAPASPPGSRLRVRLETPLRGVAPGQTVVLYDDDRVLAAATLEHRA